jgi:hypothetical protein
MNLTFNHNYILIHPAFFEIVREKSRFVSFQNYKVLVEYFNHIPILRHYIDNILQNSTLKYINSLVAKKF